MLRIVGVVSVGVSSPTPFSAVLLLSLLVVHRAARRRRRRLEALGRGPAEAGSAAQAVPQKRRARLTALGDDLVELRLQAEAAGGQQQRQRYRRVHDH